MKKLKIVLVSLLLLVLTMPTMAQKYVFNAYHFLASTGTTVLKDAPINNIPVTIDFNINRAVIYSERIQVIDFELLRTHVDEYGHNTIECTATDSDYKVIRFDIEVREDKNLTILYLYYTDFAYAYFCRLLPN